MADQPSQDPHERLRQLRVVKTAYENLTAAEPSLPPPDSALPALLAVRTAHQLIVETKVSIKTTYEKLTTVRQQLSDEEAALKDARLLTEALEKRVENLQHEYKAKSQKTPEETAKAAIQEQQTRKTNYEKETKKLIKALVKFIDERLAGMLAAEELGGPVVGDLLDVTDEMLDAGFSQHGKPKKAKSTKNPSDTKRQQRIDQIWGQLEDADVGEGFRSEREATAAEMRALTEELLNEAAEEGNSGKYVTLVRDSAAARFLVRAKVAQFHPRDARKLRLVDFARGIDD